jgi:hypothetical protein
MFTPPPLPLNIQELNYGITDAIPIVTPDMLQRVWQETDYRWNVCRITGGRHIAMM